MTCSYLLLFSEEKTEPVVLSSEDEYLQTEERQQIAALKAKAKERRERKSVDAKSPEAVPSMDDLRQLLTSTVIDQIAPLLERFDKIENRLNTVGARVLSVEYVSLIHAPAFDVYK